MYEENQFKVKPPITSLIGGILCIITGIFSAIVISIDARWVLSTDVYFRYYFEDLIYLYIFFIFIIIGGILILLKKNKLGSAMAIFFGLPALLFCVLYSQLAFFLTIISILGGILGIILKEKIDHKLLKAVEYYRRIKISELSLKLGINEADIELTVIKLQNMGKPVRFNRETREIIYGFYN